MLGISALAAGGSSTDTTKPQQTTTAPAPKQQTPQPQPVTPKPAHILTDAEAQSIAQQYLVNETVESAKVIDYHDGKTHIVLGIAEDDASIGHTSSVMYLVASAFENKNVAEIAFVWGDNNNNAKYMSSVTFTSPTEYTATQPQPIS